MLAAAELAGMLCDDIHVTDTRSLCTGHLRPRTECLNLRRLRLDGQGADGVRQRPCTRASQRIHRSQLM